MSGCFESDSFPFDAYAASVANLEDASRTLAVYAFASCIFEHFRDRYRSRSLPKCFSFEQVFVNTREGKLEAVSIERSGDEMLSTPNGMGFAMRDGFHFVAVMLLSLLGFKLNWPLNIIEYREHEPGIKAFLNKFFEDLTSLSDDARGKGQYLVHAISHLLIVCRDIAGLEQLLTMRSHHDFLLSKRPRFLEAPSSSPVVSPLKELMVDVALAAAKLPDDACSINSGDSPRSSVSTEPERKSCCTCWFGASKEGDSDQLKVYLIDSGVKTYGSTSPDR